jgi:hypothetical protein
VISLNICCCIAIFGLTCPLAEFSVVPPSPPSSPPSFSFVATFKLELAARLASFLKLGETGSISEEGGEEGEEDSSSGTEGERTSGSLKESALVFGDVRGTLDASLRGTGCGAECARVCEEVGDESAEEGEVGTSLRVGVGGTEGESEGP